MKFYKYALQKGLMQHDGRMIVGEMRDDSTPKIDLLVREAIQNSCDQAVKDTKYVCVDFSLNDFNLDSFCEVFDEDLVSNIKDNPASYNKVLVIRDTQTYGLTGDWHQPNNDTHSNLYSLVYSIKEGNSNASAGGKWGIGKTVYYSFGLGIVFYYSRILEDGIYKEILVGNIFENQYKEHTLLGKGSQGVAWLGARGGDTNEVPGPVYDSQDIHDFLNIIGLDPFKDNETGTCVIIPFFDSAKFLENVSSLSDDDLNENNDYLWARHFDTAMDMVVQRWYFPRLNNLNFPKLPYLEVSINGSPVELNTFFKILQNFAFGRSDGTEKETIPVRGCGCKNAGSLYHKIVNINELGCNPPHNLPSPRSMVGIDGNSRDTAIAFYFRQTGMVIKFCQGTEDLIPCNIGVPDGSLLIACFALNDDAMCLDMTLGNYFRGSERANHAGWSDWNAEGYPEITKKHPYKRIQNRNGKILRDKYGERNQTYVSYAPVSVRTKLAKLLLPQIGYGKGPSNERKASKISEHIHQKNKPYSVSFEGFKKGDAIYLLSINLPSNSKALCQPIIKAGSKKYSLNEWLTFGFETPCKVSAIELIYIDAPSLGAVDSKVNFAINGPTKINSKSRNPNEFLKFSGLGEDSISRGFCAFNSTPGKCSLSCRILMKITDPTFSINLDCRFLKDGEN